LKGAPVTEKMRSNRSAWYGHVMRRDETHITKRVMKMGTLVEIDLIKYTCPSVSVKCKG
jgi:(2Fe-2S) ferredoxin